MAALFRGAVRRASAIRSSLKSASATKSTTSSSNSFASKQCSGPKSPRLARLPRLGCAESLLPLHSAVAAARLTSCLTSSARNCRALSQELGLAVPR